jgi:hypothetical protein
VSFNPSWVERSALSSGPLTYQPHQIADLLDHRSDLHDADALRGRGCLEFAFQAGTFALRLVRVATTDALGTVSPASLRP